MLGPIRLPRPERVAYYGGLGLLAALEVIDWPVAVAFGAANYLAAHHNNRTLECFGKALERA